MLLWKLFRLTFFYYYYCKSGWLIVDQACCSLVGRQRACLMRIRCLPYAWLLLAAIENTAQMLQFELRPCINSTNLCWRLLCIWLKQFFKSFNFLLSVLICVYVKQFFTSTLHILSLILFCQGEPKLGPRLKFDILLCRTVKSSLWTYSANHY